MSTKIPTELPVMRGDAVMARGASYFEVPLFSHVIDNLWQGCSPAEFENGHLYLCEEVFDIDKEIDPDQVYSWKPRFDKILNLYPWGDYFVPKATEVVKVTAFDSGNVDYNTFQNAALLVLDWLDDGHKVLVHCQAGLNRSSFVVALVLMEKYHMTPDEAISHIRKSRSEMCLCNNTFRQYLKGLR